jgi:hypothetical protein
VCVLKKYPHGPQRGGSITPAYNDPTGAEDDIQKQGKRRGPKVTHPWEGVHAETGNRLHLAYREDRQLLLVLFESGRHILCARVDRCGAIAEW